MKKRILALALAVCLGLLSTTALADETPTVYDVYQGDGFYITAKPYTLKSTKYTMGTSNSFVFDGQFHDGLLAVWTADVDENYVNRQFVREYNFADKDGNVIFPSGFFHDDFDIHNYGRQGYMSPSEGMVPFWDGETKDGDDILMGFVDYSGREVIGCKYLPSTITPFREGLSNVFGTTGSSQGFGFIDKSGSLVIQADPIYVRDWLCFSDGLVPCLARDENGVYTYGYMNTSGDWAMKLCSYNTNDVRGYETLRNPNGTAINDYWSMYADGKINGYLMPYESEMGAFSDGYAVCYDLRSGNRLSYSFAIIDKSGNVVGTFSDAEPTCSGFRDGLMEVEFFDNRNNSAGRGFINTKGEIVIRESDCANPTVDWHTSSGSSYSCGLLVVNGDMVVDTKGNTVIPEGVFQQMHPFDSDISTGFLSPEYGGAVSWGVGTLYTRYVFEKHTGTYTGSGSVYNASAGGAQTTTPAQPETPVTPPAAVGSFTDVAAASPFKDAILWAVDQGITNGTSGTTFSPSNTCTVRQILTFLYRSAGKPGAVDGQNDLDAAVAWATSQGLLPEGADSAAACTRSMAVEFMWKAAGSPAPSRPASFSDVASDAAYADAVAWAVEKGITNGTGGDAFSPNDTCTRGQIVTFLYRSK